MFILFEVFETLYTNVEVIFETFDKNEKVFSTSKILDVPNVM